MFAKAAVFFFALAAFINAAPIIDYCMLHLPLPHLFSLTSATAAYPGVRPLHPINSLPDGGKRGLSLDTGNDIGPELDFNLDAGFNLVLPPSKRRFLGSETLGGLRPIAGDEVNRRDTIDLNTFGSQILNGLKSHGLNEYIDTFSARIQRLKDLPSDVPLSQVTAEADNLLREYNQVLAGLRMNKPVETRDIVVDTQVLAQLQNFAFSTVNLLRALGKPDGKYLCLSVHPGRC